jgi:hypothetical protein
MKGFLRTLLIAVGSVALISTAALPLSSKLFSKVWKDIKPAVIPNPIQGAKNAINLLNAIGSSNPTQVKQVLGQTLLNSPGCLACEQIAHVMLPNLSTDQINLTESHSIT